MERPTLILASGSPRRQELIRTLGLPYRIDPANVDESMPEGTPPDKLVEQLSVRKAQEVCSRLGPGEEGIVIGSDTVVVVDGRVLGKPKDEEEACAMLRAIAGRTHQVFTGLACIDARNGAAPARDASALRAPRAQDEESADGAEVRGFATSSQDIGRFRLWTGQSGSRSATVAGYTVSNVTFGPMNDEQIRAYVRTGEPLDKAGGYGIQGAGSVFIEKIEGDFYSIMGLPLNLLYRMLLTLGVSPFH